MFDAGIDNLQQIAKISKSNGIKGEVIFTFQTFNPEDLSTEVPIFIIFDGLSVPFFMENIILKANKTYVKLVGVNDIEAAEELLGKAVYMQNDIIPREEQDDMVSYNHLIGFELIDKNSNKTGQVVGFEEIPNNFCLYVCIDNQEYLIPFNEELILDFNPKEKKIIMSLPEGLLN